MPTAAGNTIHNTPISGEGLSVLYWFPHHAHERTIRYYWKKDVRGNAEALARFATVDRIRSECIGWLVHGTGSSEAI